MQDDLRDPIEPWRLIENTGFHLLSMSGVG